jgi:hypothetical protein
MQSFPSLSEVAETVPLHALPFEIRYDDLTQHGHIKQVALPLVLGRVCFGELWTRHPLFETRKQGIAPILSRLVLEADAVAVSFSAPLEGRGRIEVAHETAADGAVSALMMNAYGEIWGMPSRRGGALRSAERQPIRVGRAFGEHVLTKPYGAPSERKVLSFDVPGQPSVPNARYRRVRALETASLPAHAEALDPSFRVDLAPITFGLTHTDVNQHVNSLVYARVFEEAALRRCAEHGHNQGLLAQRLELNYRKPCFAGESMQCVLQSYLYEGQPGAIGYLAPAGTPAERAHCSFRLQFRTISR